MSDANHDFETITLCVTKRCMNQLRNVSRHTGRQVESLAEAAIEDAAIQSEREYKPEAKPTYDLCGCGLETKQRCNDIGCPKDGA